MTVRRIDLPTVGGVLLALFGLAALFDTGVANQLGLEANLTTFVGGIALAGAMLAARVSTRGEHSRPEPPVPETKAELPIPGEDIDDLLAELDESPFGYIEKRQELRERLATVGVAVLIDRFGIREEVARETIDTGVWTDDPHAVAFFVGEYPEWAPLRFRLRDRASFTRTPPSVQVEHVVSELLAIATGEVERLERAPHAAGDAPDGAASEEASERSPAESGRADGQEEAA